MQRIFGLLIILTLPLFLGSCSSNSAGGYTIGQGGSPAWHSTAPRADKNAYFDRKSLVELCNVWSANYPGGKTMWQENRNEIGYSLSRRGKDPMYCANPQADEVSIIRAEANRAKRETERARQEAKRACEAAERAYRSCRAASGYGYYSSCRRPSC